MRIILMILGYYFLISGIYWYVDSVLKGGAAMAIEESRNGYVCFIGVAICVGFLFIISRIDK